MGSEMCIRDSYNVEISQKVARFINADDTLEYYIALEPDSSFG